MQETAEKAAFIAIVGRPNAGKSFILNRLLGQKIAIASNKPQAIRTRIIGVPTEDDVQPAFLDTPGLHKPYTRLGDYVVKSATGSIVGVDAYLPAAKAGTRISSADHELVEKFSSMGPPVILAINKIDILGDESPPMAQVGVFIQEFDFEAVVLVSAKDSNGMTLLKQELMELAQPGGHFFADGTLTDQPEHVLMAEMVHEKILRLTDREVPHSIAVAVESMKEHEGDNGITDIQAIAFYERDTHKGILIGKNGPTLKKIGMYTRGDMERLFNCKISLQLWVRVKEDWHNRENLLRSLGCDSGSFQ